MRHYMVDPDNEERLLKVPPSVVAEIKAEALSGAVQRVEALMDKKAHPWASLADAVAAIKGDSDE
jgi:ParB-like chromosome segregation protein Spo0J